MNGQIIEEPIGEIPGPPETPAHRRAGPAPRPTAAQPTPAAAELEDKVRALEASLAQARAALDAAERRHRIDLELIEADASDLEAARLLTEAAVAAMPEADVKAAVADLRARRPYLFRPRAGGLWRANATRAAGPPEPAEPAGHSPADLARAAALTGDRRALLRYLRARR
ncbi:MAG: hypothetical protein IBJ11_12415 [Phycisphaerales bacterium]|nr:hypothetical protein [Phycisphaerales bacterium]